MTESLTREEFNKLENLSTSGIGHSVVKTILEQLGDKEAGVFTLNHTQYAGLRIHANSKKAIMDMKVRQIGPRTVKVTPKSGEPRYYPTFYKVAVALKEKA